MIDDPTAASTGPVSFASLLTGGPDGGRPCGRSLGRSPGRHDFTGSTGSWKVQERSVYSTCLADVNMGIYLSLLHSFECSSRFQYVLSG